MAVDKKGRKLPKGIRQRGQTYEGRLTYEYKNYTVHGRTIGETQKALTDLKYRLEHGMYTNNVKLTVDEWFNTWMEEYKKNQVKIGTYLNYKKYYDGMIKASIGQKQVNSIRGDDIQKLYNMWVKREYAISTIKIASAVVNGCFKQAEKNGLIERNPVKLATLPKKATKKKKVKKIMVLTKDQQKLFMKYAEQSYLYNLFEVMLRTGMRSGEIRGLIYGLDIDKKSKVIHIQRTLKYESGMGFFTDTPKTKSSEREIPLTKEVEHYLDDQQKLWWGNIIRMDRFLFCNYNGDPLSRECVQGEIDRIVERIRKDGHTFPRITSHVFRHTFATRAIEAGMKPQVLKSILGHSSLAMTMDLYSHVLPDSKAKEMEKIAEAF